MSEVIDAASNPALVNQIVSDVLSDIENETAQEDAPDAEILTPPDTEVTLPGGYYSPMTGLVENAEVRELTGRDEEIIARTKSVGAMLSAVLTRGVVSIGDSKPDDSMLNSLLAGDRDYLLLRIFSATFGDEITTELRCPHCGDSVEVTVEVTKDVPVKSLESAGDRAFEVPCSVGLVKVELPTGHTQKELFAASSKSWSELSTMLLANTVMQINGTPVMGPQQVLDLPIRDRRKIAEEIGKRNPGPQFNEVRKSCPECEGELEVPLNLASLFQF